MITNPLLTKSLPATPFDQIRDEHFLPALTFALKLARERLQAIGQAKEPATFENTIEALESASQEADEIGGLFSNLLAAHTSPKLQDLSKEILPQLAGLANDIYLDAALFSRVREVYEKEKATQNKKTERNRLIELTYRSFIRNGALLAATDKEKLREIDRRKSLAGQKFADNLLKESKAFEFVVENPADLAGLPPSAIEAAAQTARDRGAAGKWTFTLDAPSYSAHSKYAENRDHRQMMWMAYNTRATQGDTDNRPLARELALLRHQRAELLGYETHSHFVLEERMASHPDNVDRFLKKLIQASRPAARKDLQEIQALSGLPDLKPWDFAFYTEKLKQKKYNFDEEKLRPYFPLGSVTQGAFQHAQQLYGLEFLKRTDIPVYHEDVEVFEVRYQGTHEQVGLLYTDFFPRKSKRDGAWMTSFREQWQTAEGTEVRPHVSIVCNFTKPTAHTPSLLTYQEVRTLFHEFGHALHLLLSRCRYRTLSGTNVYWDFVELPSQIMENWTQHPEGLRLFAKHYETGESLPLEWMDKIQEIARFQSGWMFLRQLEFALLDMAWHSNDPKGVTDVENFEKEFFKETSLFPHTPGRIVSCGFSHIFSGGYSSGYYSYKWAEVLDADAFELFKEKGLFDSETAKRFQDCILSRGGSEHPMELYKSFRGREPDEDALLRRSGLK
jgi:peptidyl-dipeptidase Dcp